MHDLKPLVSRHWLFLVAGLMWTGVGIMLLLRAWGWLSTMPIDWEFGLLLASLILAGLFYRWMFVKTVNKNLRRLAELPDPVSLFAFNSPKGYILIIFMITLGILLRRSGMDTRILAVVYATMGVTLSLASLHFYRAFHRATRGQHVVSEQS
ncbi:MAG TPA: hypothetical protein ENK60_05145 [Anaerolineae bacterium]|nr:hypothetical protein [Anaerolineae bacterium]